ncbi:hypothetical protein O7635_12020 [Asanoa sp. WMMD1127]|uniref:hypothetical protein n=1 Tax=Asanoa sp. WMMD1127 TaxID=3016107 RepID=UPI002417B089|nr:hypothetical protein [Asanoa sp. WMMD1127]MDG4822578.1 hypothetical protein [Asanoa sp. WMMD1127]
MKKLIATSPAVLGGIAAVAVVAGAGAALAAWRVQSDEVVLTAETATLSPGNKPAVTADGNLVTVSWKPNSFGERKVDSYRIQRYDLAGAVQQPRGSCEENVAKESCTDSGVPTGSWRYTVVPVKGGWTGPESAKSDAVIVAEDGKATVIPDPVADKTQGPAAGPAVVKLGDPADAAPPAPGAPPKWTLQPGGDGVLGTDDTLTYVGGDPIDPKTIIEGWDGGKRPVIVQATAGDPAVLTVDDGSVRVFGPLAVPAATVPADVAYTATLAAINGRIVVTLGAVKVPPRQEAAPTTPPTADADTPPATPEATAPGPDPDPDPTTAPATPDDTPSATESTGGDQPASTDETPAEGQPETPATDPAASDTPPAAEVTPSTAGETSEPAVVLVAAT